MAELTPFLWFDADPEAALAHYRAIFPSLRVESIERGSDGSATSATFTLLGQRLIAFRGGPHFRFNEAISLLVTCETQAEIDTLWEKLCAGGAPSRCGWLKDRFGLSWQIVPAALPSWLRGPDPAGAKRATEAMLGMTKLDSDALARAYRGT